MLATFTAGSGLDGRGSKRQRMRQPQEEGCSGSYLANPTAEEEEQVYNQLAPLTESMPIRQRERVEEVMLGAGANGIAFIEGPRVSVAFEGDVAVFFSGALSHPLGHGAESPAHDLLQKYASGQLSPSGDNLNLGGHLSGEFAVVIFDKLAGRVLAARDHRGAELLFWGTSNFGEMLLISTDRRVLEMNCADADAFPPGTLFCSKDGEVTGELTVLMSDDWDGEEDWAWEETDFLVQTGEDAATTTTIVHDGKPAEDGKQMEARISAERRLHMSTTGAGGLTLSHCKRSFQNLNRIDSERSLHSLHESENNLHRVGSTGEIHAAA